jgi:catechol 2,3-dioxygenase-like lactoylglutathione lyase family enzyme
MATSLRMELFVSDLPRSVDFYRSVLGFEVERHQEDYASLRDGSVVLGLVPVTNLPESGGPGFTRARLAGDRGAGVEVVLEVDDLSAAAARVTAAGYPMSEPQQRRPWGLTDFRLVDPDGYYLRITHHPQDD